jgi:hypothetical protein
MVLKGVTREDNLRMPPSARAFGVLTSCSSPGLAVGRGSHDRGHWIRRASSRSPIAAALDGRLWARNVDCLECAAEVIDDVWIIERFGWRAGRAAAKKAWALNRVVIA